MVLPEKLINFSLSNNILWSKVSKTSRRLIKILSVYFPFTVPFKVISVNRDKHVCVE